MTVPLYFEEMATTLDELVDYVVQKMAYGVEVNALQLDTDEILIQVPSPSAYEQSELPDPYQGQFIDYSTEVVHEEELEFPPLSLSEYSEQNLPLCKGDDYHPMVIFPQLETEENPSGKDLRLADTQMISYLGPEVSRGAATFVNGANYLLREKLSKSPLEGISFIKKGKFITSYELCEHECPQYQSSLLRGKCADTICVNENMPWHDQTIPTPGFIRRRNSNQSRLARTTILGWGLDFRLREVETLNMTFYESYVQVPRGLAFSPQRDWHLSHEIGIPFFVKGWPP
jgi:hypothetical protein